MIKALPYVLVFVGLTMAAFTIPEFLETYAIAEDAEDFVSTRAKVLSNYTKKHKKGPSTEYVEFSYVVDGRDYRGDNYWTRATDDPYELDRLIELRSGQKTMLVYYDPNDPERVVIRRDIPLLIPSAMVAISIVAFVAGVQMILSRRRKASIMKRREEERRKRREEFESEREGESMASARDQS